MTGGGSSIGRYDCDTGFLKCNVCDEWLLIEIGWALLTRLWSATVAATCWAATMKQKATTNDDYRTSWI